MRFPIKTDHLPYLYENKSVQARAFAIDKVVEITEQDEALTWVKNNLDQLHETAVDIRIITSDYIPLILTDSHYPGWHATLDSKETA
ncbi:MAG: hypothetical protein GY805_32205, partial [Chloroflexi bacterium]|nr:hypothetical protein [Chloroflexota bacterium]